MLIGLDLAEQGLVERLAGFAVKEVELVLEGGLQVQPLFLTASEHSPQEVSRAVGPGLVDLDHIPVTRAWPAA